MRIAILTPAFFQDVEELNASDYIVWGGSERYLLDFCRFLKDRGNSVCVYQYIQNVRDGKRIPCGQITKVYDGIQFILLPDTSWQYNTNPMLNMKFNECFVGNYDLAIYWTTYMAYPYAVNPSIAICHGIYWDYPYSDAWAGEENYRKEFMSRQLKGFANPDMVVSVDSNTKRVMQAIQPGLDKNIEVIYNYVDTAKFKPLEPDKRDWERLRVLFPRRLTLLRGCNEFIRASTECPDFDFLAVGQGSDPTAYAKQQEWGETTKNLRFVWKPMEGMEEIYQQSDLAIVPTKACEGLSLSCLPAGTEITVPNGVTHIEDIKIGDRVLTHTGNFRKVTETMSRPADKLVSIKVGGGFGTTLKCTPEHPILAFKPPKHKNGWACRPGCTNHPDRCKYWDDAKPEWIQAGELDRGDVVVFPMPKADYSLVPQVIDLYEHLNNPDLLCDDEFVWSRYSNHKDGVRAKDIAKELGVSVYTVYNAIEPSQETKRSWKGTQKEKVRKYIKEHQTDWTKKVNRFVPVTPEFMRLLGFYLAEGWCSQRTSIGFAFHAKETDYHNDVFYLMKKFFNLEGTIKIDGNKAKLDFQSAPVREFFSSMFNCGARNKTMPEWFLHLPGEHIVELLKGLWYGDGHMRSESNALVAASYVTASTNMRQQIVMLLSRLGFMSATRSRIHLQRKNGLPAITWQTSVTGKAAYELAVILDYGLKFYPRERATHNQYWHDDKYFYGVIDQIAEEDFTGTVYNIEVEEDNSYVANNIVVHNCLESMACSLPTITTHAGGLTDATIDGYNTIIFDPVKNNLSEIIKWLAANPDAMKVMGERNRQIACDCFDIELWKARWDVVLRQFGA